MKVLYIIRGVAGAGKTTLGNIINSKFNFAADDYFDVITKKQWSKELLQEAHDWCRNSVEEAMKNEEPTIVVSNTATRKWEYEPYAELAKKYGYEVIEVIVKSNFKSVHNVPQEKIDEMRERFEY